MAFDPLDGSSIVDTNFSVGTIFGIWPGDKLKGITGGAARTLLQPCPSSWLGAALFRSRAACSLGSASKACRLLPSSHPMMHALSA